MEDNLKQNLMFEMLLTLESRLNAFVELSGIDLELFNEATQKHRISILKHIIKEYPDIEIRL